MEYSTSISWNINTLSFTQKMILNNLLGIAVSENGESNVLSCLCAIGKKVGVHYCWTVLDVYCAYCTERRT